MFFFRNRNLTPIHKKMISHDHRLVTISVDPFYGYLQSVHDLISQYEININRKFYFRHITKWILFPVHPKIAERTCWAFFSIIYNYQVLEPARLAPSATNRQLWFFTGNASTIHTYRVKSSFLTAFMFERMSKVSMGIAICHVWIAAKHFGKEVEFICDKEAQNNPPAGHDYVVAIKIK